MPPLNGSNLLLDATGVPVKVRVRHERWLLLLLVGVALSTLGIILLPTDNGGAGFGLIALGGLSVLVAGILPAPDLEAELKPHLDRWMSAILDKARDRLLDMTPNLSDGDTRFQFNQVTPLFTENNLPTKSFEISLIYAKGKSILFFQQKKLAVRVNKGFSQFATVSTHGEGEYTAEELFFSSIGALSSSHSEEKKTVVSSGCTGASSRDITIVRDGFVIRSQHESYTVNHHDSNEIRSCMRNLNERIHQYK